MIGTIKWYSDERGFGFLTDENGCEHYFNALDYKGTTPARRGDQVNFMSARNHKGPRARQVMPLLPQSSQPIPAVDTGLSRVKCRHCQKLMVPRVVMGPPLGASKPWTPVPKSSICPFCAKTHEVFPASKRERFRQTIQWIVGTVALICIAAVFMRVL